jgi:hypothetical protein
MSTFILRRERLHSSAAGTCGGLAIARIIRQIYSGVESVPGLSSDRLEKGKKKSGKQGLTLFLSSKTAVLSLLIRVHDAA